MKLLRSAWTSGVTASREAFAAPQPWARGLIRSSAAVLTWTPETEPALMRASLPARIGQEKLHESQTPQPRADHSQVADR